MHVNENKNLVGRRFGNFCESPEAGKVVNAGMRAVRNTIDRFVHVVATSSKHRQFLSAERFHRGSVGRAMVNRHGAVVGEQIAPLDICSIGVGSCVSRTPRQTQVQARDRRARGDVIDGMVRREIVIVVMSIHQAAELELSQVVQTSDTLCFDFGLRQSRQ